MLFTVSGQQPASLSAVHTVPLKGNYDPAPAIQKVLVDPLFTPITNHTVSIVDDKGNSWDQSKTLDLFYKTLSDTVNTRAE